jgi:hypothetical protein
VVLFAEGAIIWAKTLKAKNWDPDCLKEKMDDILPDILYPYVYVYSYILIWDGVKNGVKFIMRVLENHVK